MNFKEMLEKNKKAATPPEASKQETKIIPAAKPSSLRDQINQANKKPLILGAKKQEGPISAVVPPTVKETGPAVETKLEDRSATAASSVSTASNSTVTNGMDKKFGQHVLQPDKMPDDVAKQFEESLNLVVENFENKEILGQAVSHTMQFLQQHPALCEILLPEQIQLLVRGLRESYGVKVVEKKEKKEKRSAKAAEVDDLMQQMGALLGKT